MASQFVFTILYPTVGVVALAQPSAGFGLRCRVQSNNPFVSGDYIWARLLLPGVAAGIIIEGIGFVSGGSQQADIIWGWDTNRQIPAVMELSGPSGFYLATVDLACDVRFEYYNAASVIQDSQTFPLQFLHDPVTGAGRHTLQRLWDQAAQNLLDLESFVGSAVGPTSITLRAPLVGLAGSGVINLTGATGVRSSITAFPPSWGYTQGTPRRYIPALGTLQFGQAPAYFDAHLVHYVDQFTARDAAYCSQLRYNFRGGVIATLRLYTTP